MNFGKVSLDRLATCHPDLQLIMNTAIEISDIDFGIAEGARPVERQQELYAQGRTAPGKIVTWIDGVTQKSKHNMVPSMACDIYIWINGKAIWDNEHLSYIAGLVHGVSAFLFELGRVNHVVRWGGNFDMDGQLVEESSTDRPHFELIKK